MQLITLALLASTATATAVNQAFTVRASEPNAQAINNAPITAVKSNLYLNKAQDASCDETSSAATFYINEDGALELYRRSATPQWAYVTQDKGAIGYTTGAQPAPQKALRNGWAVVDGALQFNEQPLRACPTTVDGEYAIWVGNPTVANEEGCFAFTANVVEMPNPVSCEYSQ
ncbi:uncharacterized protein K452DRAFT_284967 [Aplosporella prunicola CBS 121167]|uniref:Cell wall protein PhiA n=1 Tax=Aplosporella prunicola CBS 121167 TaxID=1176127 RepID=A0A6A6BKJ1_9PEZI|nr:uncharacterized protein K452DRAFT_284967 [Aplosporella prunicola CBS 121167]KAF2144642.1 hypothetical protein K452DRAFT_284967 [Aplosporella prunicola CBS 121167]